MPAAVTRSRSRSRRVVGDAIALRGRRQPLNEASVSRVVWVFMSTLCPSRKGYIVSEGQHMTSDQRQSKCKSGLLRWTEGKCRPVRGLPDRPGYDF